MDRRSFLWNWGGGLGGIALASMLGRDAAAQSRPEFNGGLHHPAKAKRVIQLFMSGAASQCDTFDYKPRLIRHAGEKWDPGEKVELFQSNPGVVMPSPWAWKQHGQCGKWVSDLSAAHRRVRRRHCVRPLADVEVERARAGDVHAEHRIHPAGIPELR